MKHSAQFLQCMRAHGALAEVSLTLNLLVVPTTGTRLIKDAAGG